MDKLGFLTVYQAAEMLGVSPHWIYRRIGEKDGPPYFMRGSLIRLRSDEFEQWAMQRKIK